MVLKKTLDICNICLLLLLMLGYCGVRYLRCYYKQWKEMEHEINIMEC